MGFLLLLGLLVIILATTIILQQVQAQHLTSQKQHTPGTGITQLPTNQSTGTTASPAKTGPSGQAMPVGDIPGWHQVFADDFTTNVPLGGFPSQVADKWSAYPDGWQDSYKNGVYYPSKVVSIRNGVMNLYLHTENGVHMVAAPEPKIAGASGREGGMLYGRYVVRFRSDPVIGYKTAWLLWPDSEVWPRDGEIDFPEGGLEGSITGFMHHQGATGERDQFYALSQQHFTTWHTAVTEWSPNKLTFLLDGVVVGSTTDRVPNTPMHWVLQTETTRWGPRDTAAGNLQIDWITVYALASTATTSARAFPLISSSPSFSLSLRLHLVDVCDEKRTLIFE